MPDLTETYGSQVALIRARVLAYVQSVWSGLGSYRDADVQRLVKAALPVVLAGQRTTSQLTDAYLRQVLTATGQNVASGTLTGSSLSSLRGVDPADVYQRPFLVVWTALAAGKAFQQSQDEGLQRLLQLASTDMQLAKTHTARNVLGGADIAGYRRVLNGLRSCGLCIVASTQLYHKEDLLPIHPACDCSVAPVTWRDKDSFDTNAADLLEATHDEIRSRLGVSDRGARAPDYRKQLIVHQHGEMGPTLGVRGQHFTSHGDIPALTH